MSPIERVHRRTLSGEPRPDGQRGQAIVLFALALTAIVAMVGLVLDGGATFAQRRSEQNAADLAALGGANNYLVTGDRDASTIVALSTSAQNGYDDTNPDITVATSWSFEQGAKLTVTVTAPHRNNFAGIVGQGQWIVSAKATAQAGFPDTAYAAGPMIFSVDVFDSNGNPKAQYSDKHSPYAFGETNGDVPSAAGDLAWTNYGTGNLDTNEVDEIITGSLVIQKQIAFGEYIGQHNNGYHDYLFDDVNSYLAGEEIPVPVVDHNGNFQGWATLHVTSASGGSDKKVSGYFVSPFLARNLSVGCRNGNCPRFLGTYVLRLTN